MAEFPPKPGQPGQKGPQQPVPKSDGQVEGYSRVVNGKVIKVNAYAKGKTSPQASAQTKALAAPGRPQMSAKPGSYASGRQIPGIAPTKPPKPAPKPPLNQPPGTPPANTPKGVLE